MTDTSKTLPKKFHQLKLPVAVFARYHLMNICWQEELHFGPEFPHSQL